MRTVQTYVVIVIGLTALSSLASGAPPEGRRLGRGMDAAARAPRAQPGMQRAGQRMSQVGNAMSRAPRMDGRGDAMSRVAREQGKFDHRLSQADHLRGVAERNGNERLGEAADRMADRAQTQFDRKVPQFSGPPVPPPDTEIPVIPGTDPAGSGVPPVQQFSGEPAASHSPERQAQLPTSTESKPWWKRWVPGAKR